MQGARPLHDMPETVGGLQPTLADEGGTRNPRADVRRGGGCCVAELRRPTQSGPISLRAVSEALPPPFAPSFIRSCIGRRLLADVRTAPSDLTVLKRGLYSNAWHFVVDF